MTNRIDDHLILLLLKALGVCKTVMSGGKERCHYLEGKSSSFILVFFHELSPFFVFSCHQNRPDADWIPLSLKCRPESFVFCLSFKICLKYDISLSLNMFTTWLATALLGWYFSARLCTSLHFEKNILNHWRRHILPSLLLRICFLSSRLLLLQLKLLEFFVVFHQLLHIFPTPIQA